MATLDEYVLSLEKKAKRLTEFIANIDMLRSDEGDTVLIPCDNPEFDGPDCFVECHGSWTNWQPRRFTGKSLFAAIDAAAEARSRPKANPLTRP